jgi:hypothetical protein
MASSNHHGTDDKFAKGGELAAEGRGDGGIAETEADVAAMKKLKKSTSNLERLNVLCRHDFEKYWEYGECLS